MIAILNYGLGNLRAFANIYHRLNISHCIADTPQQIATAERLILPGVGAFDHAMQRLKSSALYQPLVEAVIDRGVPVLGVCVGMQMLARSSEEGAEPGLGWIAGEVARIRFPSHAPPGLLPHMGWSTIKAASGERLLDGLDDELGFYFLHTYRFICDDEANVIATADYAMPFHSAVRKDNIYGVQFHPEKSHHNGVTLLKNFAGV